MKASYRAVPVPRGNKEACHIRTTSAIFHPRGSPLTLSPQNPPWNLWVPFVGVARYFLRVPRISSPPEGTRSSSFFPPSCSLFESEKQCRLPKGAGYLIWAFHMRPPMMPELFFFIFLYHICEDVSIY